MRLHPGATLHHWGKHYPSKLALTMQGISQTYAELNNSVDIIIAAMQRCGVISGDHVAFICPDSLAYVQALYACLKIGAVVLPFDYEADAGRLQHLISLSNCKVLFVHSSYEESEAILSTCCDIAPNMTVIRWSGTAWEFPFLESRSTSEKDSFALHENPDFNDIFAVLYSSGTTSEPKGIRKTYYQFVSELFIWITELRLNHDSTLIVSTPTYYTGGFILLLAGIFVGAHVIIRRPFEISGWIADARLNQATHVFLTPQQTKIVLEQPSQATADITTFQMISTVSDATRGDLKLSLADRFQCSVVDLWGNTEGVGTVTKPSDLLNRPDTIGKPFLTDDTRIVDETLRELPPGEIGEIIGKSDNSFLDYANRPDLTAETIKDGWILSGDLGWRDEAGYFYYAGRKSQLINYEGIAIYPRALERLIETNVAVREAAVFGFETKSGERPVAGVILKDGQSKSAEDILNWANQQLSPQQQLADLLLYDDFPRTPAGKVIKQRLLEYYVSVREKRNS